MKEYARVEKKLYYCSVKGIPINQYQDLNTMKLNIIIVDSTPRLQFNQDLNNKINKLGHKIESVILKHSKGMPLPHSAHKSYQEE